MRFSPFTHSDIPVLDALRPPDWTDTKIPFQFYLSSHFCFPIKLTNEDKIIGVGCAIIHDDVAWLGHIIVHPDFRNQGHGTTITKHLIKIAKDHKTSTIFLIATNMGAPVYSKLGFVTETEYLFYKDVLLKDKFVLSDKIVPFQEKHFDQLYQLDKKLSSENRLPHLTEHCNSGIACNLNLFSINLINSGTRSGLPNFNESYFRKTNANICITGFAEIKNDNVLIFPNPARDWIEVRGSGINEIALFDVLGNLCYKAAGSFTSPQRINVSNLTDGIYFIDIKSAKTSITKKIIKH